MNEKQNFLKIGNSGINPQKQRKWNIE